MTSKTPELGFYSLAGHTKTPADLITEIADAEKLGLGSVWLSERFDVKEIGALCGAAAVSSKDLFICTGATNHNTRHPLVTAGLATTVSRLSGGRFALGIGRGFDFRFGMWGLPTINFAQMEDAVGIWRKLWAGERVMGHDGPAGKFPYLHMAEWLDEKIPLVMCGFGPKTLEFAGKHFDAVLLTTFLSDETVSRCVENVRRGEEAAGKEPGSVKVWTVLATACNLSEEQRLHYIVARMATYMQAPIYSEMLVKVNGWDTKVLEDFRKHPIITKLLGGVDSLCGTEELAELAKAIPEEWLPAAVGTPEQCAERFQDQFKAGADGVVLHASTPKQMAPAIEAYGKVRVHNDFKGRTNSPAG
ncbi:MAG: TIGR03857 family LLM class F420-dependent oxidoreductase [Deltaproteobacteria bacterium]|nr:TIGR03857 family LLM class F420-dependent oxidoreductase [Deltaproteobacteria bacterium]